MPADLVVFVVGVVCTVLGGIGGWWIRGEQ